VSKEALFVAKELSWCVTLTLVWLYAYSGYSDSGRWFLWVCGALLIFNVMLLGAGLSEWLSSAAK
jgi:hypothetical protein